jgi:hypothetical protein
MGSTRTPAAFNPSFPRESRGERISTRISPSREKLDAVARLCRRS